MDQAITSSHPVCSTLGPTACLAGNSDPTHLLSGPEKSNLTEGKICTFVTVTSSRLSDPALLVRLEQMAAIFLKGLKRNPKQTPKISKSIYFYSMQKSYLVLQSRARLSKGQVATLPRADKWDRALLQPSRHRSSPAHHHQSSPSSPTPLIAEPTAIKTT